MAGGHAWWGVCMAGGMHGRGCMVGSMQGRGVCMVGGAYVAGWHVWHGRGHVWQEGVHGRGASVAGGCA